MPHNIMLLKEKGGNNVTVVVQRVGAPRRAALGHGSLSRSPTSSWEPQLKLGLNNCQTRSASAVLVGPDSLLCFQLTCRIEPACTKKLYATNIIPTHTFLLREVFSTVASLFHTLVAFIVPSKKCSSVFPYNTFFLCSYETPSSFIKQQQARTSH